MDPDRRKVTCSPIRRPYPWPCPAAKSRDQHRRPRQFPWVQYPPTMPSTADPAPTADAENRAAPILKARLDLAVMNVNQKPARQNQLPAPTEAPGAGHRRLRPPLQKTSALP